MNVKYKDILMILGLIFLVRLGIVFNTQINNPINRITEVKDYLIEVDKRGDKTVVFIITGTTYVKGEAIFAHDRIPLNEMTNKLKNDNYTVIKLGTPCSAKCSYEYTDLGLFLLRIEPDAVIYKGIVNDEAVNAFGQILKRGGIPLYIFGTEILVDYNLYTGPDNQGLGKALKDLDTKEGETALYLQTNLPKAFFTDNGVERMIAAENTLREKKVKKYGDIYTDWVDERAYRGILNLVKEKKEAPDYIIVPGESLGEATARAVEFLGIEKEVKIVVLDFTPRIVELLKSGRIYAAAGQELKKQGQTIAGSIINDLHPKKDKTQILFSTKLIRLENLSEYEIIPGEYNY